MDKLKSSSILPLLAIGLILLLMAILPGCGHTGRQTAETADDSAADPSAPSAITAFGTVRCAERRALILPADLRLTCWLAVEGQALSPGDPVLQIDLRALSEAEASCALRIQAAEAALACIQARISKGEADLAVLRQAAELDPEDGLAILEQLARAQTRTGKDRQENALLDYLSQAGSLPLYAQLANLAADARNVRDNARPILLQMIAGRAAEAGNLAIEQEDRLRQLLECQAGLGNLQQEQAALLKIRRGDLISDLGAFNSDGQLICRSRAWLLDATVPGPGEFCPGGAAIAWFCSLPARTALIQVDEQLITGVQPGATVQLSPLYDKTTIWLGTVSFISAKAVIINGETVIPVLVSTDEDLPGPGYTLAARILPPAD